MFCVAICGVIPRSFPLARIDTTGGLMGSLLIDFSIVSTFFYLSLILSVFESLLSRE